MSHFIKRLGFTVVIAAVGIFTIDRVVAWKLNEVIHPQRIPYTVIEDAAGEPKQLWLVPGATHIAAFDQDPSGYETKVVSFFDQYLLGKTPVK